MKQVFSQVDSNSLNKPSVKTTLVEKDFSDSKKLKQEIKNVEKLISNGETKIINEKNISEDIKAFESRLNKKIKSNEYSLSRQKELKNLQNTDLFKSLDMQDDVLTFDSETDDEDLKRQLAAVIDLIRETKKNIAALDKFWLSALTNKGLNLAKNKSKFIKTADDMGKEADKVTRKYYNDLYDDSEGSPNYGDILEHPEDYHHTLTTEASQKLKSQRFKKV
jgi:hypothetical protein